MNRKLVVDEAAAEEAEAQVRYYAERAGMHVALRFVSEIEAIYRGLAEGRFAGVNHQRVRFRLPVKRVFIDRFPFAVVFYVEDETVRILAIEALHKRLRDCDPAKSTLERDQRIGAMEARLATAIRWYSTFATCSDVGSVTSRSSAE